MSHIMSNINYFLFTNKRATDYSIDRVYAILFEEYPPLGYVIIIFVIVVIILGFCIGKKKKSKSRILDDYTEMNKEAVLQHKGLAPYSVGKGQLQESYEELDMEKDKELVAIITAAMMAYIESEEDMDGLVIRSIRKVNRRRQINDLTTY